MNRSLLLCLASYSLLTTSVPGQAAVAVPPPDSLLHLAKPELPQNKPVQRALVVVNGSSLAIKHIFEFQALAKGGSQIDYLPQVIPPNQNGLALFNDGTDRCVYDLVFVFSDNTAGSIIGANVCQGLGVEIRPVDSSDQPSGPSAIPEAPSTEPALRV